MSRTTTDVVMSDLKPTHSVQLCQLDAEELLRNFIGVERRLRCPQFPHLNNREFKPIFMALILAEIQRSEGP